MAGVCAQVFSTPLGWVGIAVSGKGIVRVVLPQKSRRAAEREVACAEEVRAATARSLSKAVKLLKRGLSGTAVSYDLPIDLTGYTDFQKAAWKAAASIPYGETRSYGWIAKRIGRPLAARAVGQAMGANPVPILVP